MMTNSTEVPLRRGTYIAATSDELASAGLLLRGAAMINQRVLFRHRGTAELFAQRLVLRGWSQGADLTIRSAEVTTLRRTFTPLYGRFVGGGSSEWGAPVIMTQSTGQEIYILFDHRAFLEKSTNVDWHLHLLPWSQQHTDGTADPGVR